MASRTNSAKKVYPDMTFERAARAAGATVKVLWEQKGPPNTAVLWLVAYAVNASVAIVQTFEHGGWEIFTPGRSVQVDETLADAFQRCGVKVPEPVKS